MTTIPKGHPVFLVMLLLTCAAFFASCGGASAQPTVCSTLTPSASVQIVIDHPVFVKQADDGYRLTFSIANCGTAKVSGIDGTWGLTASTISQAILRFGGSTSLAANSKGTYNSNGEVYFVGDQPSTLTINGDINISGSKPASLHVIISVTAGGVDAAKWDGQVAVPS